MQTEILPELLSTPEGREAEEILRACVHCGFCTATCPTYQVLGDELDSPRGRIYLIKDMLENGRPADEKTVKHVDRCLSCLACMTTCPSGVHYMHLVDHAREYIENTYKRPLFERVLRQISQAGELGQFRTPRHIIRSIVRMVDPQIGETVYDPALHEQKDAPPDHAQQIYQYGPSAILDRETALALAEVLESHGWFVRLPAGAVVGEKARQIAWQVAA